MSCLRQSACVMKAVPCERRRHACSCYRIEYNFRMLLKAEFQPSSVGNAPIERVVSAASNIILGKETQVRLALACLLARGHLLIEDLPGVGKTTLAHVLAKTLGLQFQRIQFTSDMLPADILGVSIYERDSGQFQVPPRADLRAGRSSPTRSTARRRRRSRRCSRRWRSTRSPPKARRASCPRPSSSSPRRTRPSRSAPSRCPSRSSTAS